MLLLFYYNMKKITIIVKKLNSKIVEKFLKKNDISKYFRVDGRTNYKFEFILTDLKTPKILEKLKKMLNGDGFITVNPTNLIYPNINEKCSERNLEELIIKGVKNFTKIDKNYILFTVCAAMIACFGFQIDNIIVLISAMIICPLMSPIMASSYALSISKKKLIFKALNVEIIGIALILIISILMSLFPNPSIEFEKNLANTNLIYSFMISLIIGVISANSFLTGKHENLTGAAVGISLLPPITNSALLFSSGNIALALSSMTLFIINIVGMHLSSISFFFISKEK